MKLQASPVKASRDARHRRSRSRAGCKLDGRYGDDARRAQALQAARPDVMVVAAYGLILPPGCSDCRAWVPQHPRLAAAALARRARSIAPSGPATPNRHHHHADGRRPGHRRHAARSAPVDIRADDTTATLHDRLAALGGRLIVEALELAACGGLASGQAARRRRDLRHKDREGQSRHRLAAAGAEIERRLRAPSTLPRRQRRAGGRDHQGLAAPCPPAAPGRDEVLSVRSQRRGGLRRQALAALTELQRRRQTPGRRGLPERPPDRARAPVGTVTAG